MPWVVIFLVLTWASTLLLGRRVSGKVDEKGDETGAGAAGATSGADGAGGAMSAPPARVEFASYVMRALYQETLFFLLPFYFYSMVWTSPNVVFVALLAALALMSCLDLVFDRLLRQYPVFGLVFFATVAFAAVNLVLPILLPVPPRTSTIVAAVVALGSSMPLALRDTTGREKALLALPTTALLVVAVFFPSFVPPVPLRLDSVTFSSAIDRETLTPADSLESPVPLAELDGALAVLMQIFAPSNVPTAVRVEWRLDGTPIRTSRNIEITAHQGGFRIWDAWRPTEEPVRPGRYEVTVLTQVGRVFGRGSTEVR